jgi:hypothetical protein
VTKLPFFFDARGYEFQSALEAIRRSAQAGLAALSREINLLEQQLEDYYRAGNFEGERDENGYVIWERDDILNHEIAFAQEALMELRKAFAIAAFHHWERSVQRWITQETETAAANGSVTRKKKSVQGFNDLSREASRIGYATDPKLQRVVTLVNTLKHNGDARGMELLRSWRGLFPPQFQTPSELSDWASAIRLTDQHLDEVFDVVSKSGPTPTPE